MFWVGLKDWLPSHFFSQIVWLFLQGGLPCLPQHFTDVFKDWLPWHFFSQIVWLFLQGGLSCLPQHFTDVLGWFQGLTAMTFFGSNCLTVFTRRTPLLTPTFYGCFWLVSRIDCHDTFWGQIVWLFLQGGFPCLPQHFTDVLGWFKGLTAMSFFGSNCLTVFTRRTLLLIATFYRCFGLVSRIDCHDIFWVKLFDCFYKEDSLAYPNILQMFWVGFKDWLPWHFLGQIVWLFLQGGLPCLPQHFTDVFKDWLPWHFFSQIVWLFLQGGLSCLPQHLQMFWVGFKD